jgi:microcystin-dependent protein
MFTPFLGEIRLFGGTFAPIGWLFCQGQILSVNDYPDLFKIISNRFGGDGVTTFALPDMQGRVPLHFGSLPLGLHDGLVNVLLATGELPVHTHAARASGIGTTDNPQNSFWAGTTVPMYDSPPATTTLNPYSITLAGGNKFHENRIPYLALNFIIAIKGDVPQ